MWLGCQVLFRRSSDFSLDGVPDRRRGTEQQHLGVRDLERGWKSLMPCWGDIIRTVAASATTTVEIDSGLLERLRLRRPAKSDRELLESVARIQLGREAGDRASERFRGVPSEEIEREALNAVREVRNERAAKRRASG